MKNIYFTILMWMLVPTVGCAPTQSALRVIQTTDIHGHFTKSPSKSEKDDHGGLRRLAAYVEQERARGPVLLLDSGDMWSGTLLSDPNEGRVGVDAFNALGYDAAALGNHEFDYGAAGSGRKGDPFGALKARLKQAKFSILAANLVDRKTGELPDWPGLRATRLVKRGGFTIGLIGIVTPETPSITFPHVGDALRFDDPVEVVRREAVALRTKGADLIFVVAHEGGICKRLGDPNDRASCWEGAPSFQLAMALEPGTVHAIFGGHTHRKTAHWVNGVAVIQSGKYASDAGVLDIVRVPGEKPVLAIRPLASLNLEPVGSLAEKVDRVLGPAEEDVKRIRAEKLGARLIRPLTRDRIQSAELGTYLCDVMLKVFPDRDICMLNSGGMRNALPAGDITYGSLYDAFPFGNHAAFVDVPGEVLLELLRIGTSGAHGVFQVAGVEVDFDLSKDFCPSVDRNADGKIDAHDRDRILNVRLADGSVIAPDKEYRIIMNNFMASGGDGLRATLEKTHASRVQFLYDRLPVREQLAKYWRQHKPVINSPDKPVMSKRRMRAAGTAPDKVCPPTSP
jgi:5'-nucleotidase